ncbi:hypothetical protein M0R72_08670 [Candidatus Pacearchaeota archaeon]|jgi:predicted transcriptional regulator|nr:hypothetical protein [Candidatus Pacearchaeota archaeon]
MRIRARKYPGKKISTVLACMWPRSRYWLTGPKVAKNGNCRYAERDRAEILAYIVQNGPVSCFDIELCCHHEKAPVMRHLAALEGQHKIEGCYFSGEKFRVV